MPDPVGGFRKSDTPGLALGIRRIKQAQLHALSLLGKEGKINALTVPGGAERVGSSRQYCLHTI
jgi:hypothetical protein